MYTRGYFPTISGGNEVGTGLNPEQTRLLAELKGFEEYGADWFGGTLNGQLQNIILLADNAKSGMDHLRLWREAVIPDKYAAEGSYNTFTAQEAWNQLLSRDEVQPVVLRSAMVENPDNTVVTEGVLLREATDMFDGRYPSLAWKDSVDRWRTDTDTILQAFGTWKTGVDADVDALELWKFNTSTQNSAIEMFLVTDTPNTFFCRLRPPNRQVQSNAVYLVSGTGHYSLVDYELFYFRLITHGPNPDTLANQPFQFTVFNNSTQWSCRVTCNNLSPVAPVVFVRGTTVSKSVGNTIIRPRQGVRFTFIPLGASTYIKDGHVCPAFLEDDLSINTSLTLLPPNNLNYDFTGVEGGLPF